MILMPQALRDFVSVIIKSQPEPLCFGNVDSIVSSWEKFIESGIGIAFGECDEIGLPAGLVLALFVPDILLGVSSSINYLWIVRPDAPSGTAMKVFREWENHSRTVEAKQKSFGAVYTSRPDAMKRLARRLGYFPHSWSFVKNSL